MSKFDKMVIGLEIFRVGTHTDSQGMTNEFTVDDVNHMVDVFGTPEFVPVKLGHTSDEFQQKVASELGLPPAVLNGENEGLDGVAALGQVVGISTIDDPENPGGKILVADLKVPDAVAALFGDDDNAGYFGDVSCELSVDDDDRWILDGLALLGAERPAVEDLAGISEAYVARKRVAVATRSFSQKIPKRVKMSAEDDKGKFQQILDRFKFADESLNFSELIDAGLKLGEGADKGAVKDAVQELQARSTLLDEIVVALEQLVEMTKSAAEDGEEIIEDEIAAEPAMAARALIGRIARMSESKSKFKSDADFNSAVATRVVKETKELTTKVNELIAGQTSSSYRIETEKLVGMEGTAEELATQLADLEATAGKETAGQMLSAWKQVSDLNIKSGTFKAIGSDLDGQELEIKLSALEVEAADYRKENPNVTEKQAQQIVNLRAMASVRKVKPGGKE